MDEELKKLEKEIAEKMEFVKKLNEDIKKLDKKRIALVEKQIDLLTKEKQGAKVVYNRTAMTIKKRNEKKRKSRTHLLCVCGGEYEKTFFDLTPEKATEFFSTIRKVFPSDIQPEEISSWLLWLHKQKVFRDWVESDPDP